MARHGTVAAYNRGCRCEQCNEAKRRSRNESVARRGRTYRRRPYGAQLHKIDDSELMAQCWCQEEMVWVPQPEVVAGLTRPCDLHRCHLIDIEERARRSA